MVKVFEFPCSSWHSHEDCHKLTTVLYQSWKGSFSLQGCDYKQLPGERERFSCHATLSFCVFKSKVTNKHITGACWTPLELGTEGESLLCVICDPEMNPFVPELGPELRAPEKQSNYHYQLPSFFFFFFFLVSNFLFCVFPSLFGDSEP